MCTTYLPQQFGRCTAIAVCQLRFAPNTTPCRIQDRWLVCNSIGSNRSVERKRSLFYFEYENETLSAWMLFKCSPRWYEVVLVDWSVHRTHWMSSGMNRPAATSPPHISTRWSRAWERLVVHPAAMYTPAQLAEKVKKIWKINNLV